MQQQETVSETYTNENFQKATQAHDNLRSLGANTTHYKFDQPDAGVLESFPSPSTSESATEGKSAMSKISLCFQEFTSLCPKTNQPDFAHIDIQYVPDKLCVETKSLKLYFFSFRNHGAFMEDITNRICMDLAKLLNPLEIKVVAQFATRGGVDLSVECLWDQRSIKTLKAMAEATERLKGIIGGAASPSVKS